MHVNVHIVVRLQLGDDNNSDFRMLSELDVLGVNSGNRTILATVCMPSNPIATDPTIVCILSSSILVVFAFEFPPPIP